MEEPKIKHMFAGSVMPDFDQLEGELENMKVIPFRPVHDDWDSGTEVTPADPEPKKCTVCNSTFLPKFYKEERCGFCRRNKIFLPGDKRGKQPF